MQPINQLVKSALTEVSAQPTKEQPISTKVWAEWLKLETFGDPEIEALVNRCAQFCLSFKSDSSPCWLSLLGKTGAGKTHCATRIWNWMAARSDWHRMHFIHQPIYWPKMVADLKQSQAYEMLSEMAVWPVLFLDDIGAERDVSGFAAEQLNTLLGQRIGKWTIITSNLSIAQLAKIDPRIADRIIRERGNQFIEINAVSYAVRKMKDNPLRCP